MLLHEGMKLKMIVSAGLTDQDRTVWVVAADHPQQIDCESITVVEQNGQIANVPWATCKLKCGNTHLVNLATVEAVEPITETTTP